MLIRLLRDPLKVQWLMLVGALAVLGAVAAYVLYERRESTLEVERQRLVKMAEVMELNFAIRTSISDNVLTSIIGMIPVASPESWQGSRVGSVLATALPLIGNLESISLADHKGRIRASTLSSEVDKDVSASALYLRAQRNRPGDSSMKFGLALSGDGEQQIALARPLWTKEGQFSGALMVSLRAEMMHVLLNSVRYAEDMRASMVSDDGTVMLVSPQINGLVGKNVAVPGSFFSQHVESGRGQSFFYGKTQAVGDMVRIGVIRTVLLPEVLGDQAAYISLTRDPEVILASWRADVRSVALAYFGLAVAVLLLQALFYRRQKASAGELQLASAVFEHSHDAVMVSDYDRRIIKVNPAFTTLTGYLPDEVIGKEMSILRRSATDEPSADALWSALNAHGFWRGEIPCRRKNGEEYVALVAIASVEDSTSNVKRLVFSLSDISHIKDHAAQLEMIAHFDPLTGIPNRRLLEDRMRQALERARRREQLLALVYLDLDGFKPINDSHGHDAGDIVLVSVARRLETIIRAEDTVARLGGDEFVLLLGELQNVEECELVLARVLGSIELPIALGESVVSVSASIGVTIFPLDDADSDTLLRHADQAMYGAKRAGKRQINFFKAGEDGDPHLPLERTPEV